MAPNGPKWGPGTDKGSAEKVPKMTQKWPKKAIFSPLRHPLRPSGSDFLVLPSLAWSVLGRPVAATLLRERS